MASSRNDGSRKVIVDSIHGNIPLNKREVQVIDTASFQRLRHLKQLAMAQLVYPTATHTRFAHSIGALGTMIRILETVEKNGIHLPDEQKDNLRLAALLHDVGHYPYSHLMEKLDNVMLIEDEIEGAKTAKKAIDARKSKYPEHPEVGALIVTGQDDLVKALGDAENAKAVADIFTRAKAFYPPYLNVQSTLWLQTQLPSFSWMFVGTPPCGSGLTAQAFQSYAQVVKIGKAKTHKN